MTISGEQTTYTDAQIQEVLKGIPDNLENLPMIVKAGGFNTVSEFREAVQNRTPDGIFCVGLYYQVKELLRDDNKR